LSDFCCDLRRYEFAQQSHKGDGVFLACNAR
jgi:hypothetical protein